jgi:RsiW-degrading membrane proteinase PrsW (M82 family)
MIEIAIKVISSLAVFLVFFLFYFRNFTFRRSAFLESGGFFYGLLSASATLLLQRAVDPLIPADAGPALRAFLHASLTEELVRFALLYWLLSRSSDTFTAVEGVFTGIMTGLGFAVAENLYYSASFPGYVILLRSLTCIPLHALLSGLMAFYISYGLLRNRRFVFADDSGTEEQSEEPDAPAGGDDERRSVRLALQSGRFSVRRFWFYIAAFALPFALHGVYDWILLGGNAAVYLMAPLLLGAFLLLEFRIAQARIIFGRNVLQMIGIDADDLDIILPQREYERRIDELQEAPAENTAFFLGTWQAWRTVAGAAFLAAAILIAAFAEAGQLYQRVPELSRELFRALFVAFPLTVSLILLLGDKINYLYFRDMMLRTPAIVGLELRREDGTSTPISVLDLRAAGVFLSGAEDFKKFERVRLMFGELRSGRRESDGVPGAHGPISVEAVVSWSNRRNRSLPVGHVCRFEHRPFRFALYRLRYQWAKFLRRLADLGA